MKKAVQAYVLPVMTLSDPSQKADLAKTAFAPV
jgi:hypothetical protein